MRRDFQHFYPVQLLLELSRWLNQCGLRQEYLILQEVFVVEYARVILISDLESVLYHLRPLILHFVVVFVAILVDGSLVRGQIRMANGNVIRMGQLHLCQVFPTRLELHRITL